MISLFSAPACFSGLQVAGAPIYPLTDREAKKKPMRYSVDLG